MRVAEFVVLLAPGGQVKPFRERHSLEMVDAWRGENSDRDSSGSFRCQQRLPLSPLANASNEIAGWKQRV